MEAFFREKLPIALELYRPTFWCYESRMQTVFANLARWVLPSVDYVREVNSSSYRSL